jgi:ubiquinone/menaquinone biosynthesis C-methylase UbiE
MSEFLSDFDVSDRDVVSSIDDLPLWSAPFGLKLLDVVAMRPGIHALDVGCGFGFPLVDLSQRLGPTCTMVGIDPWTAALERVRLKVRTWGITNVELVEGGAESMPFDDASFDLIVSNNGTNNVDDEPRVFAEIARVAKPGAQFAFTVNLPGTMREFYDVFRAVLRERGDGAAAERLDAHIHEKRKPAEHVTATVQAAGFEVRDVHKSEFSFRYIDGTAMLNHFFIRLAFAAPWKAVLEPDDADGVFAALEARLNRAAQAHDELRVTIPWICVDCRRRRIR